MKSCYGRAFDNLDDGCKVCKEFTRCYLFSKAKVEKKNFKDIEREREQEKHDEYLRGKGYRF